jgi:hypothetical protein
MMDIIFMLVVVGLEQMFVSVLNVGTEKVKSYKKL